MESKRALPKGARAAAWTQPGIPESTVWIQGDPAGLEALAKNLLALAKEANSTRVRFERAAGTFEGDSILVIQRSDDLRPPPNPELQQTRVEAPDDGDTVVWLQVPETAQAAAAQVLLLEAGYTTLQARETVERRSVGLRTTLAIANRLRDAMRKAGAEAELFHAR